VFDTDIFARTAQHEDSKKSSQNEYAGTVKWNVLFCIVFNYGWHTDTNIQKHDTFVRSKREMVKG
jgi:hypothetical protein